MSTPRMRQGRFVKSIRFPRVPGQIVCAVTISVAGSIASAAGFASGVVGYIPGADVPVGYNNPANALGSPTRFTGELFEFPGAVSPFNPAFEPDELVTVGRGGELVIRFDQPITDDPLNPFGVDLLVFGNAGFIDTDFPNGRAGALFGTSSGSRLEVSPDGISWTLVAGVQPDGNFPTLAYTDLSDPYSPTPGSALTDFLTPVDPTFSTFGKSYAQIVAGYNGSGGGTGVDLGALGLSSVQFVRVSTAANATSLAEIDAFADVRPIPSPAGAAVVGLMTVFALSRRRESSRRRECDSHLLRAKGDDAKC
jgi:hypothetical protein